MHASVYDFVTRTLGTEEVAGKRILEVGALDVNGSVRPYVTSLRPAHYLGTDRRKGRRVDLVVRAERLHWHFDAGMFDVVLCLETLEHVHRWRMALWAMVRVLAPDGLLLLTTRSPGFPRHDHPDDWWRFTRPGLHRALTQAGRTACRDDPEAPGVFCVLRKACDLDLGQLMSVYPEKAPEPAPQ